jgi:LPXTG-motif cell wall-anchored protein
MKNRQGENEMNSIAGWTGARLVLVAGVLCLAFTHSVSAPLQTKTTTTSGQATVVNQVESGEVVTVSGNDLVVKMSDGTIRHFANVPESARVTVDGQDLGIHDLKPGMKLQRTITTTTTPKTITTVQSVTGKVWHVSPPTTVILTLEDGTNQQFKIPKNQKFNVDGQIVDAWGLKKGMKVSATKVVEAPVQVVAEQRKVTGTSPPPPPPADVPILVAEEAPAPAEVAQAAPAELPKTGSELPLIGLLGLLLLASSLGLRTARSR